MAITDKQLDSYFQVLREHPAPLGLSDRLVHTIHADRDEQTLSSSFRWAVLFSIILFMVTLTSYSAQQTVEKIAVGYHSYIPKSYSEKIALSNEKITENTLFCMLTEK